MRNGEFGGENGGVEVIQGSGENGQVKDGMDPCQCCRLHRRPSSSELNGECI